MKVIVESKNYGTVSYEESFWTGKKTIIVNGKILTKVSKNVYALTSEKGEMTVRVTGGSLFYGISLAFPQETIQVSPAPKWYEVALAAVGFALVMVWGNNVALCSIVPVVGGAIGGGISAVCMMMSMYFMKNQKKMWTKLLVGFGMLALTFAICALVGMFLVGIIN